MFFKKQPALRPKDLPMPDGRNFRLLIVDDDPDAITDITAFLQEKNPDWEIDSAFDGNVGFEKCFQKPTDLLLLDMMLPKRSGFLVLEKINKEFINKPIRDRPVIIMITANPGSRHKRYAFELGVNGYLNKPFRNSALWETIIRCLEEKQKG